MSSVTYDPITATKKFAVSDFDDRFRILARAINDNDSKITDLNDKVTALEDSGTGNSSGGSSGTSCDCASKGYITQDTADDRYATSVHTHSDYLTQSTADNRYALKGDGSTGGGGGGSTWTSLSKEGTSPSFTLEADTEYTCSNELTSLTIILSSFTGEAIVNFKSGNTATTFTCSGAKMIGLNCFGGTFTPAAKMCYTIMFDYDGTNVVGYVGGYTNV